MVLGLVLVENEMSVLNVYRVSMNQCSCRSQVCMEGIVVDTASLKSSNSLVLWLVRSKHPRNDCCTCLVNHRCIS